MLCAAKIEFPDVYKDLRFSLTLCLLCLTGVFMNINAVFMLCLCSCVFTLGNHRSSVWGQLGWHIPYLFEFVVFMVCL